VVAVVEQRPLATHGAVDPARDPDAPALHAPREPLAIARLADGVNVIALDRELTESWRELDVAGEATPRPGVEATCGSRPDGVDQGVLQAPAREVRSESRNMKSPRGALARSAGLVTLVSRRDVMTKPLRAAGHKVTRQVSRSAIAEVAHRMTPIEPPLDRCRTRRLVVDPVTSAAQGESVCLALLDRLHNAGPCACATRKKFFFFEKREMASPDSAILQCQAR
jgi:hypothetical protein